MEASLMATGLPPKAELAVNRLISPLRTALDSALTKNSNYANPEPEAIRNMTAIIIISAVLSFLFL